MRRFFCKCCGKEITTSSKRYTIKFYDRKEKKTETIMHLCEDDIKKVRNMKFVPEKNVRIRTIPKFFNIIETHEGKEKSLYMIPEWNLKQIHSVAHADNKNLFLENGKRYWTPEYVISLVDGSIKSVTPNEKLMQFVQKLYEKQTEDEKAKYETKYHNNRGFNKPDAKFMSAMARVSFEKGWQALSEEQINKVRKIFMKYAEQVADIMNEEV